VGRRSNRRFGSIAFAVVAVVASLAHGAVLRDRARLREGPSKDTRLLGWVEEGVTVTIEGERSGWYAVRTADGQSGYIWQEHLRFEPGETPASSLPPPAATTTIAVPTTTLATQPPAPAASAPSDLHAPERPDVHATGGADTAVATELQRLRTEVSRLATAQQELSQEIARAPRSSPGPAPLGAEGSAGAAVLFFGAGALVGWIIGRFAAGRRERRSRLRM
jgi:hypothetical protein